MSVTPNDVRHVARLARVGLTEARIPSLVNELNGILAHMDVLQQVDIRGVAEAAAEVSAPLRDDALPASRDGFFLVPRLATHGALGASASEEA
jgi:aspartyl-tRNA(Asn)/glutamyl-tRNA(Gln) amidotransferase subunit C